MIRIGRIVDVIGDAGNGLFNAQIVKLVIGDSPYEVTAYAKELSDLDLLVEIVSALLGIELNIPIPEPIIAFSKDGTKTLFASVDAKYPDLTKRLHIVDGSVQNTPANQAILKKLSEWEYITGAISFDEWIANEDRNLGNILFDGIDAFSLIDHNLAMRPHFSHNAAVNNKLMDNKLCFSNDEITKQRLKNTVQHLIDNIERGLPKQIAYGLIKQANAIDKKILDRMIHFLELRLACLAKITTDKIPVSQRSL